MGLYTKSRRDCFKTIYIILLERFADEENKCLALTGSFIDLVSRRCYTMAVSSLQNQK